MGVLYAGRDGLERIPSMPPLTLSAQGEHEVRRASKSMPGEQVEASKRFPKICCFFNLERTTGTRFENLS